MSLYLRSFTLIGIYQSSEQPKTEVRVDFFFTSENLKWGKVNDAKNSLICKMFEEWRKTIFQILKNLHTQNFGTLGTANVQEPQLSWCARYITPMNTHLTHLCSFLSRQILFHYC